MITESLEVGACDIPPEDEKAINDVNHVNHVNHLGIDNAIDAKAESLENAKKIIDQALIDCADNAGVLGSAEFMAAYKLVSSDKALLFEYRTKIRCLFLFRGQDILTYQG